MKLKFIFLPKRDQDKTNQAAAWLSSLTFLFGCLLHSMFAASVYAEVRSICLDAYVKAGATPAGTSSRDDDEYIRCYSKAYGALLTLNDWMCAGWPLADNVDIPEFCGAICEPVNGDLGKTGTMVCTRRKNKGTPDDCEGNPCNPVTGNKFETEVDYRSSTGRMDVVRYYNSLVPEDGPFGFGWTSSLTPWLGLDASGPNPLLAVHRADGRREMWRKADGAWKSEPDSKLRVEENSSGFVVASPDLGTEQYDKKGRLMSLVDLGGLTTHYKRDADGRLLEVVDPWDRKLSLSYGRDGRISSIVTPDGSLRYDYDGQGNLIRATYPDNASRQYLYGEREHVPSAPEQGVSLAHAMTGLVDENKVRFATWSYDKNGKVASSEHAGGIDKVAMEHKDDGSTTVKGPLGETRTYAAAYYHNVAKTKSIDGDQCSGCGGASRTYDANGNLASRKDGNGHLSCYAYELDRNLETVRVEGIPSGQLCPNDLHSYSPPAKEGSSERKISTQWHQKFRLPTAVAEPLRLTSYSYDDKGNLTRVTVQATADTTGGFNFSAEKTGKPQTTSYAYNSHGQLEAVDGPRTDVADRTTYQYDNHGNVVSIANALNHVVTLGRYDKSGRPGLISDPNGLTVVMTYDSRGRIKKIKIGEEESEYQYDFTGNLSKLSLSNGMTSIYSYDDAHRMTSIEDNNGNRVIFYLDNSGNQKKIEIIDRSGVVAMTNTRIFNKNGKIEKYIGANGQNISYEYDGNGNIIKLNDPYGNFFSSKYDALDRITSTTDPEGQTTQYSYDRRGQLTWVIDPRGLKTQYVRDGFENLVKTVSPDAGTITATFDEAGNLRTLKDAGDNQANYSYDALNRLTSVTYDSDAKQNVMYAYDQGQNGIGRLTSIADATGSYSYSYDKHGRIVSEQSKLYGKVYKTTYKYDRQGRMHSMVYPSGRSIEYEFDDNGRIHKITTTYDGEKMLVADKVAYHPFGGVASFVFGNGQHYSRTQDKDGRISSYTLDDAVYNISYDIASNIKEISGMEGSSKYTYNMIGWITSHSNKAFNITFSYDLDGNVISKKNNEESTKYLYNDAKNMMIGLKKKDNIEEIAYDANGSMINDKSRHHEYDARRRLVKTTTEEGYVSYAVNSRGLRVRKKNSQGGDTIYHYDIGGKIIAESDASKLIFPKEYIYLYDQIVAILQ